VDDRIHLADVGEELIAEALALLAPRTRPAMSTNSSDVGMIFADLPMPARVVSRSSGTATRPTFGSMVQNG
jgi:hypothetical protein